MSLPKNQLKLGIVLNYINMGLGNLIPIFYTPIMLSILGQNEYGLYKLSSSVISYLGLMSLGIGSAVTRYLIKAKTEEGQEAEERMMGLFLVIYRIVAVLVFIVGVVLVLNLNIWYEDSLTETELDRMKILVFIMVCNMALSFSVSPYMSIVTAREKFIFFQCMSILNTCVVPVINLIVLYLGYASIGLAMTSLVISVVMRVVYYIYVKHSLNIHPRYKELPVYCLKEILIFSFWIFIANLVSQLYNVTDTLMIGAIPALATVGVAVYNIGTTLHGIMFSLSLGASSLLMPKTNKLVFEGTDNNALTDYAILVGRLQGYIVSFIICAFIVFGMPFIHFYVGDGYLDAYWIMLFLAIPSVPTLVQSVCLNIVVARNQHRFRSIVYFCIAVVNVVCTWLVLDQWGIKGAAFVTGVATLMGHGFIMNWFYWKRSGLDMWRFWKQILKVILVPMIVCVISVLLLKQVDLYNLWIFVVAAILFTIVVILLQWNCTLNDYEKGLFLVPLQKTRKLFVKNIHKR